MYNTIIKLTLLAFLIFNEAVATPRIDFLEVPKAIPQEGFYDKNNNKILLEDIDNNIIILHFWATWCTFCINKMPSLDKLSKEYKNRPIKFIPVSEDFKGPKVVEKFFVEKNIRYLDIFWDKGSKLQQAFKIHNLPTTIIINKNHKEIIRIYDSFDWMSSDIVGLIENLVKEAELK